MLHTVQFKKNVVLDKSTRMALRHNLLVEHMTAAWI